MINPVMTFSSMLFICIFLPLCIGIVWLTKGRARYYAAVALSLFYWFWNDPHHMPLMLIGTLPVFFLVRAMPAAPAKRRTVLTVLCWAVSLGLLTADKILAAVRTGTAGFSLPLGLSYISFSMISYAMDVERGEAPAQENPVDYLMYIAFFPKLLMGPIEKYRDFIGEMEKEQVFDPEHFVRGLGQYAVGLAKKVLIADVLGTVASLAFSSTPELTMGAAWVGAIAYTLQIYYDFSGYSDMAIGIAGMLGYDLKKNFDHPYLSRSVSEFWRRWHISLGDWFKRYVYFPLGGSRKGSARTILNLMIVFAATGLWHGTGLNFLAWGLWNGILVSIEHLGWRRVLARGGVLSVAYTMLMTVAGWILFRAGSLHGAFAYYSKMVMPSTGTLTAGVMLRPRVVFAMAAGVLASGYLSEKFGGKLSTDRSGWIMVRNLVIFCLLAIDILSMISSTANAFIYAQF